MAQNFYQSEMVVFELQLKLLLMCTVGGYSVLGWNHPGFGGSTVSSTVLHLKLNLILLLVYTCALFSLNKQCMENNSMLKFWFQLGSIAQGSKYTPMVDNISEVE